MAFLRKTEESAGAGAGSAAAQSDTAAAGALRRWLWIWIAIGIVIVAVVAAFLFPIANNLESIDDQLDMAGANVEGVEEDTAPLPEYIERVNDALAGIDESVDPLPKQAAAVIANLRSIETSLRNVEGSLDSVAASLGTTARLLQRTEMTLNSTEATLNEVRHALVEVEQLASVTDATLEQAERFDSLGTSGIWRRVRFLNGGRLIRGIENDHGLREIGGDAARIELALDHINKHLESICQGLPPLPTEEDPIPGQTQSDSRPGC